MELSKKAAIRLLQAIQDSIELDEMIKNMKLPTDEEVAEIEAAIANMPPRTPEEEAMLAKARQEFLDYVAEGKRMKDAGEW